MSDQILGWSGHAGSSFKRARLRYCSSADSPQDAIQFRSQEQSAASGCRDVERRRRRWMAGIAQPLHRAGKCGCVHVPGCSRRRRTETQRRLTLLCGSTANLGRIARAEEDLHASSSPELFAAAGRRPTRGAAAAKGRRARGSNSKDEVRSAGRDAALGSACRRDGGCGRLELRQAAVVWSSGRDGSWRLRGRLMSGCGGGGGGRRRWRGPRRASEMAGEREAGQHVDRRL